MRSPVWILIPWRLIWFDRHLALFWRSFLIRIQVSVAYMITRGPSFHEGHDIHIDSSRNSKTDSHAGSEYEDYSFPSEFKKKSTTLGGFSSFAPEKVKVIYIRGIIINFCVCARVWNTPWSRLSQSPFPLDNSRVRPRLAFVVLRMARFRIFAAPRFRRLENRSLSHFRSRLLATLPLIRKHLAGVAWLMIDLRTGGAWIVQQQS